MPFWSSLSDDATLLHFSLLSLFFLAGPKKKKERGDVLLLARRATNKMDHMKLLLIEASRPVRRRNMCRVESFRRFNKVFSL
jgi:hypothetical protein